MQQETIRKTKIYGEFDAQKQKEWFAFTSKKFISHVDTFYYSVKTVGDWLALLGARSLVGALKLKKEQAQKEHGEIPLFDEGAFEDLRVFPYGIPLYGFRISKEGCFDIFVADVVPNRETSPIVVQLRSEFIWLHSAKNAFYQSLDCLKQLLGRYGVKISDITENRIDFAYHTNYIQDMLSFFKDEYLGQMQVSSFKRWSKEGNFLAENIYTDYISLGRRKSNSAFVRIYNKSKEVIEMGYKQFFIPIWRENGLISAFDQYLFNKIFEEGKDSWNYKEVARCKFYLEYGEDLELCQEIRQLLGSPDSSIEDYKHMADSCVPDLTNIVNLEIQTKRKFYYDFVFPPIEYPDHVEVSERRIYKILHMLQSVREYLTYDTIRFVKFKGKFAAMRRDRRPTADWWIRLSACGELDGISYDLCKDYQKRYDVQRSKSRSLSSFATLASLLEDNEDHSGGISFENDLSEVMSYLNDNDLKKYVAFRKKKRREFQNKYGG